MEPKSIGQRISELIIKRLESEDSDRATAKKLQLSNTSIANIKSGTSIKLDTLDKVLAGYPELRGPIGRIFLEAIGEAEPKTVKDLATITIELDELLAFKSNVEDRLKDLEKKIAVLPAIK